MFVRDFGEESPLELEMEANSIAGDAGEAACSSSRSSDRSGGIFRASGMLGEEYKCERAG